VVTLLVWVVVLDHRTAEHAIGAWLVAQYLALLISLALNVSWLPALARRPDTALMWNFITFGTVTGLAGAISFLNYRIDQLLVNAIDGDVGGGIYSTAVVLAEGVWLISTAIAIASYSRVGSLPEMEAAHLTARAVRHTWIVSFAGMVALIVLANVLITVLFSSRYEGAAMSLRVLSVGTLLYAPQAAISNYFTVTLGRPAIAFALASCSLLLGAICCVILIPAFGYIGGAWATTISYGVTAALSMGYFLRRSGLPVSSLFRIQRADLEDYVRLAKSVLSMLQPRHLAGAGPRP
jgi:O-antigen/teichoic acid export membrane protein